MKTCCNLIGWPNNLALLLWRSVMTLDDDDHGRKVYKYGPCLAYPFPPPPAAAACPLHGRAARRRARYIIVRYKETSVRLATGQKDN
jgi:hypothetical protein